ncbi:DNA-directed RNA polymerase I subunit RPA2-like [Tubulanus polymorphus]|uniref:DNA-directed RNA polymerase I subunit RPA2-like n=1 Tax=Tubulanus polymorphus TaxID=672921 RepID=UPI003DA23815
MTAENEGLRLLTDPNYGKPRKKQLQSLQNLVKPHIDSFNYFVNEGLKTCCKFLNPVEFVLPRNDQNKELEQKICLDILDAQISRPTVARGNLTAKSLHVYPAECRGRGTSYRGKLSVTLQWKIDGVVSGRIETHVGEVPIMVKSDVCNLNGLNPTQLIRHGEEAEEMGGYFIVNGLEKIIRMLVMPRSNYPAAVCRNSWTGRGPQYTKFGVTMRCVRKDLYSSDLVLHYLMNGTAVLCFAQSKEQFYIPIIYVLKALIDVPDQFIYSELIKGKEDDAFYKGCIANMLRQAQSEGVTKQHLLQKFIGERFRVRLRQPEWHSDVQICQFLLRECIAIHLDSNVDKFNILVYMTRKLFSLAKGECAPENPDNPMNHEVLLGGHLYQKFIQERLSYWLTALKYTILKLADKKVDLSVDADSITKCSKLVTNITASTEFLLSTGNLVSKSGLGLMQHSGLAVVADKLNFMRYLSHFRCVHRGGFFTTMRTTAVRKLLPEAWGFMCPVHTPDGTPCGLLNHMSANCQVENKEQPSAHLPHLLCSLGVLPIDSQTNVSYKQCYPVMLNGKMVGWLSSDIAQRTADQLRTMKVTGYMKVASSMEICLIPMSEHRSQYPGLYLFTTLARMIRPVMNLAHKKIEMIGSFEQVYLDICVVASEGHRGKTTHQEIDECTMLSCIASLTPYSDFNQSPRNMYQCQMGKQTMGTPCHALQARSDNKLYRIQTPQAPVVRPTKYNEYNIDEYPLGTNAVVAVISYTGYDMEDAMILSKSSYERGFCHGSIYKTEFIDLKALAGERYSGIIYLFGKEAGDERVSNLDSDGLPPIGSTIKYDEPLCSYINIQTGAAKIKKYRGLEDAIVDNIKFCGSDLGNENLQKVAITLRVQRNPIIGDKFASRHGQKGICSQKWPVENLPFSESGMTPDIIFNPHGFPSRMTIGMMIESMAGKSAAMHGLCHDATPFTFSEDQPAIDYFGRMLTAAGYNYYGTERLYSGVDGREFEADIFIGVVYYQRLRHMVSDKFQVRTTGPIDSITHQPVKGRKRAGGIRFGEMERDGLISHGTSYLLQDRLFNCSDKSIAQLCTRCGSLLSPTMDKLPALLAVVSRDAERVWMCSVCRVRDTIKPVEIPYVFRYLVAELASMNIKVSLDTTEKSKIR